MSHDEFIKQSVGKQCPNCKEKKQQPKCHHHQQGKKAARIWETYMRVVEKALSDSQIPFVKRAEKKLQRRQGSTMKLSARLNEEKIEKNKEEGYNP